MNNKLEQTKIDQMKVAKRNVVCIEECVVRCGAAGVLDQTHSQGQLDAVQILNHILARLHLLGHQRLLRLVRFHGRDAFAGR